jgi:predicted transcriptional regulator
MPCAVATILGNYTLISSASTMTTVHIPDETAAGLRAAAQAEGRTMDELAGEGLAAYLASRNKLEALQAAIDEGDASGIAEDSSLEGILAEVRARRNGSSSKP